ncbi:MAG: hypothetical protein ABSD47_01290 [Candidatus Methylomirabilota bacterium]
MRGEPEARGLIAVPGLVVFVGPVHRGFCRPCLKREWGAFVAFERWDKGVFRCLGCLRAAAKQIAARAAEKPPAQPASLPACQRTAEQ